MHEPSTGRPPLEDRLLKGLDEVPVPLEAAGNGVAQHLDAPESLELGPEGHGGGVDGEAQIAIATLTVSLFEELAGRHVEIERLCQRGRPAGEKERD